LWREEKKRVLQKDDLYMRLYLCSGYSVDNFEVLQLSAITPNPSCNSGSTLRRFHLSEVFRTFSAVLYALQLLSLITSGGGIHHPMTIVRDGSGRIHESCKIKLRSPIGGEGVKDSLLAVSQ
jgi:hypothetical protein